MANPRFKFQACDTKFCACSLLQENKSIRFEVRGRPLKVC